MSIVLRELAAKMGLDVDAASFTKGELAASGVKLALEKLVEWGTEAVQSLIDVAKEAVETASHLNDTSQAIGISTDALQELGYAASLSGVGMEEFGHSITLLSRQMAAAKEGGEEQAKAFHKLGVKIKDSSGKLRGADDVMGDIAAKLAKMPDGAEKTALAMQFFGRSGAKMVPMLNEGADGIARMRQEARDLGIVLDADLIKQGDEIGDTVDALKAMWKGIKTAVGASLFPDILKTVKAMKEWVQINRVAIRQNLEKFFRVLADGAAGVAETFKLLARNVDLLLGVLGTFAVWITVVNVGLGALIRYAVLTAAPFLALSAALAGLVLFIDDFRMFLKYGEKADTLTGRFMKNVDKWLAPNKEDPWWLVTIKEYVRYLKDAINLLKELDDELTGKSKNQRVDKDTGKSKQDLQWMTDKMNAQEAKKRMDAGLPLTPTLQESLNRLNVTDPSQLKFLQGSDFVPGVPKTLTTPTIAKSSGQAGRGATMVEGDDVSISISLPNVGTFNEKAIREEVIPAIREEIDAHWHGKMEAAHAVSGGGD